MYNSFIDDCTRCVICVLIICQCGLFALFISLTYSFWDEPATERVNLFCALWIPAFSLHITFLILHNRNAKNGCLVLLRLLTALLHSAVTITGFVLVIKNGNTSTKLIGLVSFELAVSSLVLVVL